MCKQPIPWKVALAVCATMGLLHGMSAFPQAPTPTGQITLRVTTRMVQVNVIVQDRDGQPVAGLAREDFFVFDQGQPQPIGFFAQQASQLRASAATGPSPVNFFSNRLAEQNGIPTTLTVILLDAVNTALPDFVQAKSQIIKFIGKMQPQDRVALYGLTYTRLFILQGFTNDQNALLRALGRAPKRETSGPSASNAPQSDTGMSDADAFINAANERTSQTYTYQRVDQTTNAMEKIASLLSRYPGRKNLIWVSTSFPYSMGGRIGSAVSTAGRSMSNANVAIYPVDARGLVAPMVDLTSGGARQADAAAPDDRPVSTMNVLAEDTGGKAFYNTNDISSSVRRAIDDSRVIYVLGYYPTHNQWDGRFREIKVTVSRPGLRLRYRNGYYATPDGRKDVKQKKQLLTDVILDPLETAELGLDVDVRAVGVQGARKLKADVRVDPSQLSFTQNGAHWTDNVEIVWVEMTADGHLLGNTKQTVRLNVPRDEVDRIQREGLKFSETLDLKSEAAEVRLVARDSGSGAIGSVNVPLGRLFELPNAQRPPKK